MKVTAAEIRRLFNVGRYTARVESGELRRYILKCNPAPERAGQVPGARSQFIAYVDLKGNHAVKVHRYLRPDGTIGASGLEDPKWLLKDGVVYHCD